MPDSVNYLKNNVTYLNILKQSDLIFDCRQKSNQLVSFDDHEVIWKVNRYFSDMFRSVNRWFEITYAFTQTKKIFSLDKKAAHIDHTRNFPPDSAISCLALCKLYNCHVDHHGGQTYFGVACLLKGYMPNFCRNDKLSSTELVVY